MCVSKFAENYIVDPYNGARTLNTIARCSIITVNETRLNSDPSLILLIIKQPSIMRARSFRRL